MNAIFRRFTRTTVSVTVLLTVIGLLIAAVAAQLVCFALFGVVAAGPVIETVGIAVLMMLGFGLRNRHHPHWCPRPDTPTDE